VLKFLIDNREVVAAEGMTILQAALASGIEIPHFCYHPAFEPEGSCRMCLIEIEGMPKLELACSTRAKEGMRVFTAKARVEEARREVLEFLLAEHPLDCPICDKAGECRLQDYYERYGRYAARFREPRETRTKIIPIGRGLVLDRERCVLCTRCIRFLREVAGAGELGIFARGVRSELGLYEDRTIDNDYSGNLAEICPVGAITDRDFRFRTRPWRLKKGDSICPHCGRGCNIVVEFEPDSDRSGVARKVFRIRAKENPRVNGPWICDLGRYARSYLNELRGERVIMNKAGEAIRTTWEEALGFLSAKLRGLRAAGRGRGLGLVLNTFMTNEELRLIKRVFAAAVKDGNVWFADPKPGRSDGLLITEERSPNLRGARELGFDPIPPDLETISEKSGLLLIFGEGFASHRPADEVRRALGRVPSKFLFSAHIGQLDTEVDFVLPTALIAEKSGSLTNTNGMIQSFSPVFAAPGEARPESDILGKLAGMPGLESGEGVP
jgi:NADH-quinone oxidoreductase subunit G